MANMKKGGGKLEISRALPKVLLSYWWPNLDHLLI